MNTRSDAEFAELESTVTDLRRELAASRSAHAERIAQQAATIDVLQAMSNSPGDAQPVFDAIARRAKEFCQADGAAVILLHDGQLHLRGYAGFSGTAGQFYEAAFPRPVDNTTVVGRAIIASDAVVNPDIMAAPDYGLKNVGAATSLRSSAAVPLSRDGVPIGAVTLGRFNLGGFSDAQMELLRTFAQQAVIAITSAETYHALQTRTASLRESLEQQTATAEVLGVINASPGDLAPVFDAILEKAHALCGAEIGALTSYDGEFMRAVAVRGLSPEEAALVTEPYRPSPGGGVQRLIDGARLSQMLDMQADHVPGFSETFAKRTGLRTYLGIPLRKDGAFLGQISAYRREVRPFAEKEIALLENFASQAVIAIENARLLTETREALERQTAMAEVLRTIAASPGNTQPVFELIARRARDLCGASAVSIAEFDGTLLHLRAYEGFGEASAVAYRRNFPRAPGPDSNHGRTVLANEVIHIRDYDSEPVDYRTGNSATKSSVFVPLRREGRAIGSLGLARFEVGGFDAAEVALLEAFAEQASLAIAGASTLAELQARTNDLQASLEYQTATSDVLKVISRSTFDLQPVLDTVCATAARLCEADQVAVYRFEEGMFRFAASLGYPPDYAAKAAAAGQFPLLRNSPGIGHRCVAECAVVHILDVAAVPGYPEVAIREGKQRTSLGVPLVRDGEPIGIIVLARQRVEPFTEQQIALVSTFADQAVIAIENTRLVTEQREALERQTATAEVLQVINASPGDLTPVFDELLEKALRLCGGTIGGIFTIEENRSVARALRGVTPGFAAFQEQYPIDEIQPGTVPARIIETRRPVQNPDTAAGESYRSGVPFARALVDLGHIRAVLAVPLLKDGVVNGLIALYREEPGAFADKQVALLENFAAQAVIAMENARLLTEQREALERQTAMAEVLQVINTSPGNLAPVFDAILEKATLLCGAAFGFLSTWDGQVRHVVAARGLPPAMTEYAATNAASTPAPSILRVFETKRPLHVLDLMEDEGYRIGHPDSRAIVDLGGVRTALHIPLVKDDAAIGNFTLYRREVRAFSGREIALLENFAAQAVIAMENARLLTEQREALQQQIATAEVLQVINSSPGDLSPVFDAILQKAHTLCAAAMGSLVLRDDDCFRLAASHGIPEQFLMLARQPFPANAIIQRLIDGERLCHFPDVQTLDAEQGHEAFRRFFHYADLRTGLVVPLRKDDALLGYITAYRREVRPFSEKEIGLLENFAAQAVIAMENARLLTETQEALERQTATAELLQVINTSPGDLQPVFDAMLEKAMRLCSAAFGMLKHYDGELGRLMAMRGVPQALADHNAQHDVTPQGPLLEALQTGRPFQTLDVKELELYKAGDEGIRAVSDLGGARTILSVPLIKDQASVGYFTLYRQEVRAFTDKQIALVESFAAQAVIAMENARLLSELRDRTAELAERNEAFAERIDHQSATIDVLKEMSASPGDAQPVFDLICRQAKTLLGTRAVTLFEYDGRLVHLRATHGVNENFDAASVEAYLNAFPMVPDRGSLTCRAILDGTAIHIRDLASEPGLSPAVRALGHKTQVTIPLMRDGKAIGAITTSSFQVDGVTDTQVELLRTFAEQAVIAITSAETYRALQDRTAALAQRNSEFGERIEQQAATIDVLKLMSRSPDDTQPVFDQIVRRATELCNGLGTGLFEFDGELVHFRALYHTEGFDPARYEAYAATFPMAPTRGSISCRAILDKRMIHIRDTEADPELSPVVRDLLKTTQLSQISIPLMREGQAIGAISLGGRHRGGFTDSQIALLQTFAEQAVIAIASVANFRALRERTDELSRRQNELRVTFENMGDGVAMFDQTQHLVAWNRKFQDLLDVPDDVIARRQSFMDYIRYLAERGEYGTDADVDQQVTRLADNIGQSLTLERVRPNGTVIEVRSNPVAGGGFVLIYTDITERKRAEEGLRAARDAAETALRNLELAQASLIQAEKMASLGQLTAGIAHEIKNPLNFVNNFAPLSIELLEELKDVTAPAIATLDDAARADADDLTCTLTSNLRKIEEHGKRADQIVRGMLEHSRGSSGERRAVDMNDLVEEALNLAYHGARAQDQSFNIALERDYGAGIPPLTLAPQDMTRVLLNLFGNGFYAARKREQAEAGVVPVLRVTTRDVGDAVEIRVRDNGVGVPSEIRDKLFQPFFTTKPTGEGTGLGLSITYDIVTKQHGGTIAVDSEVGKFTEFVVSLPTRVAGDGERA